MKRHFLIAAIAATVAIPAVASAAPAAAQSLTLTVSSSSAMPQSYDRYDRGDRYDRRGGYDRGYNRGISRDEAARIGSRYLDRVTLVTQERGISFVSGRQRDGSVKLVTLHPDGRIASVVTTRDPSGRRINYDHGIGDSSRW